LSFFHNPVGFGKSSGKSVLKAAFSSQFKVAFPKTEVLGKPLFIVKNDRQKVKPFCPKSGQKPVFCALWRFRRQAPLADSWVSLRSWDFEFGIAVLGPAAA
jgi:hypothetical protein